MTIHTNKAKSMYFQIWQKAHDFQNFQQNSFTFPWFLWPLSISLTSSSSCKPRCIQASPIINYYMTSKWRLSTVLKYIPTIKKKNTVNKKSILEAVCLVWPDCLNWDSTSLLPVCLLPLEQRWWFHVSQQIYIGLDPNLTFLQILAGHKKR